MVREGKLRKSIINDDIIHGNFKDLAQMITKKTEEDKNATKLITAITEPDKDIAKIIIKQNGEDNDITKVTTTTTIKNEEEQKIN